MKKLILLFLILILGSCEKEILKEEPITLKVVFKDGNIDTLIINKPYVIGTSNLILEQDVLYQSINRDYRGVAKDVKYVKELK